MRNEVRNNIVSAGQCPFKDGVIESLDATGKLDSWIQLYNNRC